MLKTVEQHAMRVCVPIMPVLSPRLKLWVCVHACSFVRACVAVKGTDSIVLIYATIEGTGLEV